MDQPEKREEKVVEINFGDIVTPFEGKVSGVLPHSLISDPFFLPREAVLTFEVTREPFEGVDLSTFGFQNPRVVKVNIDLSSNLTKDLKIEPLSREQLEKQRNKIGIIWQGDGRNLFGISQINEMLNRLKVEKWSPQKHRNLAVFNPKNGEIPNVLIVEATDVPNMSFEIKDLTQEKLVAQAA